MAEEDGGTFETGKGSNDGERQTAEHCTGQEKRPEEATAEQAGPRSERLRMGMAERAAAKRKG